MYERVGACSVSALFCFAREREEVEQFEVFRHFREPSPEGNR
jgi:hypothetical protein